MEVWHTGGIDKVALSGAFFSTEDTFRSRLLARFNVGKYLIILHLRHLNIDKRKVSQVFDRPGTPRDSVWKYVDRNRTSTKDSPCRQLTTGPAPDFSSKPFPTSSCLNFWITIW